MNIKQLRNAKKKSLNKSLVSHIHLHVLNIDKMHFNPHATPCSWRAQYPSRFCKTHDPHAQTLLILKFKLHQSSNGNLQHINYLQLQVATFES